MPDQGRWGPLRDLRALPQAPCRPLSAEGGRYDVPALEGLWARQEGDGSAKGAADQLDPHLVQENHATAAADALPARLLPTVCSANDQDVPAGGAPHHRGPPWERHSLAACRTANVPLERLGAKHKRRRRWRPAIVPRRDHWPPDRRRAWPRPRRRGLVSGVHRPGARRARGLGGWEKHRLLPARPPSSTAPPPPVRWTREKKTKKEKKRKKKEEKEEKNISGGGRSCGTQRCRLSPGRAGKGHDVGGTQRRAAAAVDGDSQGQDSPPHCRALGRGGATGNR